MNALKQYTFEAIHITSVVGVFTTLALISYQTGTGRPETGPAGTTIATSPQSTWHPSAPTLPVATAHPAQSPPRHRTVRSRPTNVREITVGAPSISNRYTLVSVDRKPTSPTSDELIVRLHVESLAITDLVSPFGSDMLEIHSHDLDPINPAKSFNRPISGGNSLNQDVVFSIPSTLNLNHATLEIHSYNYRNEIPLNLSSHDGPEK